MIILLTIDGRKQTFPACFKPDLGFMHKAVGGYIEIVSLPGGAALVVNEDGLGMGLRQNVVASMLAGQYIVGNVLLASSIHDVCGGCSECEGDA